MRISATVPQTIARGMDRCGSFASPATKVTYCHPSYAHNTEMIERPTPEAVSGCTTCETGGRVLPWPSANMIALMLRIASTLKPVATFCTAALSRVPRTLITAMSRISESANMRFAIGESGANCVR